MRSCENCALYLTCKSRNENPEEVDALITELLPEASEAVLEHSRVLNREIYRGMEQSIDQCPRFSTVKALFQVFRKRMVPIPAQAYALQNSCVNPFTKTSDFGSLFQQGTLEGLRDFERVARSVRIIEVEKLARPVPEIVTVPYDWSVDTGLGWKEG